MTNVASRRMVNEGKSALFAAVLYGALLQRKGEGQDPWCRTADAAAAAGLAFETATPQIRDSAHRETLQGTDVLRGGSCPSTGRSQRALSQPMDTDSRRQ